MVRGLKPTALMRIRVGLSRLAEEIARGSFRHLRWFLHSSIVELQGRGHRARSDRLVSNEQLGRGDLAPTGSAVICTSSCPVFLTRDLSGR